MNIVIDATSLLLPGAGVKNHMHYWLASLREATRDQRDTVTTYPPGIAINRIPDHQKPYGRPFHLPLVHLCNLRGSPLPRLLLRGADVFHASQHMAHMPKHRKVTATVHDLSCWTVAEDHTPANIAATRRYAEKILKTCDGVIAVSSHTRRDAMEILGIPGDRIRVIYHGIAEPFFQATPEEAAQARAIYGLEAPYLLFVGCIEPRKNVPLLMRAYQSLPEATRREVELVIAGPFGWESPELYQTLTSSRGPVRYLGYVPEADLPGLFQGALALIYPSRYEGFGFPAAQAMAAGVPVIASNCSSLPEVVGDAGLLVAPDSLEELREAMQRLVTHPALAAELGARGKERAGLFRWSVCAHQSLEFFHQVAGRS
jgi:glycosyltransferase involved in cell wall biosynthesis